MTDVMAAAPEAPVLSPLLTFDEACEHVVDYLKTLIPLGFWSVSAYDGPGDRQVYLHLRDDVYGMYQGGSHPWSDSFCQYMVTGATPQIAPDAMSVPQYANTDIAQQIDIGAYVGVPIQGADGRLFGTLCGLDPQPQSDRLHEHATLLKLLATLLGQILVGERLQQEADQSAASLRWRAFHDELTGLPNRALFNDRLAHALALHRRDARPLSVLTLDVDDFKAVNDTYGHPGGDELLVKLAERIRGALRAGDTLARMGGDEFAVLLEDGGPQDGDRAAAAVAERVVAVMDEPFLVAGSRVEVGLSVGVASVSTDHRAQGSAAAESLLARADIALYTAKRGGKAQLIVYDEGMQLPEARDLQLREPLRRAVMNGGIKAVYQPIVDMTTGEVAGVECLARWTHEGVAISPDVFIPLVGRSNLLRPLTDLMLDSACSQLAAWNREFGHQRLRVAVNIPPRLLVDQTFPAAAAKHAALHGLEPRQLTLEVTEEALVADLDAARVVCDELHRRGFALSLDDFGTGYSSLLHLHSIPLDSVKIDRSFSRDVDSSPDTQRLIQAILTMSRDLGLDVIVEGVERQSQADKLAELGATHAQGYLYGYPRSGSELSSSDGRFLRGVIALDLPPTQPTRTADDPSVEVTEGPAGAD
jgi:diguanylate cyclase (GGDEF)-like protein